MADDVRLTVDGMIYGGWKSLTFRRSLEECCAAFSLEVTEKWPGTDARRPIKRGAAYSMSLGGDEVAAGYVDGTPRSYGTDMHSVSVKARCGLADIVDCAAIVDGPHEFSNIGLAEIAARLCKPYGVSVQTQCDLGAPFPRFAIQPGETVWSALDRAMRMRAVLAHSDARHTLVFTRAGLGGTAAGSLQLGQNVKSATGEFSFEQRFSDIIVRGQQESADDLDTTSEMQAEGRAHDAAVMRYRPTVIVGETVAADQTLTERAEWHKAVAYGRSATATYTVQGWRDAGGALWRPNTTVPVRDDYLEINEPLLIVSTELQLSPEGGTTATLTVSHPSAYALIAEADSDTSASANASSAGSAPAATKYDESVWR